MTPITVLYVDDDPHCIEAVRAGLETRGYTIVPAGSGPEALGKLESVKPDIILSDLQMKPMNGLEFFLQAKKVISVPFFFLTGVDDHLARNYGQSIGADGYFTKPINLDLLDSIFRGKVKRQVG